MLHQACRLSQASEVARFEYLAESIARVVISVALRSPQTFVERRDRVALEDAWANKRFP